MGDAVRHWMVVASRPSPPVGPAVWDDVTALTGAGDDVTVVVTDDAVVELVTAPARAQACVGLGARLVVDEAAARRRSAVDLLPPQARTAAVDELAAMLADPDLRTVWR